MKTEGEFNAFLSRELKKQGHKTMALKIADKFQEGISDFLIFKGGSAGAVESKFVKDWGTENSLLLSHPFKGSQQTFLESMALTGNTALGLVAVDCEKKFWAIEYNLIPVKGNWKTSEFREQMSDFWEFEFKEVGRFMRTCFDL